MNPLKLVPLSFPVLKKKKNIYKYRSILHEGNSYLVQNQYLFNSSNVLSHDIEGSVILENIQILLEITNRLYSIV